MATMNVSLPFKMKSWVEFQTQNPGRYTNTSDYISDLIRKDQDTNVKIQQMQAMVTEDLESGISSRTMQELSQAALKAL